MTFLMKFKIVVFFGLLFSGICPSMAQIKYVNNFEKGLGDMLVFDNDKKKPNSEVDTFGSIWRIRKIQKNHWLSSNSYFDVPSRADDWAITPIIKSITANTFLSWKAYSSNADYKDSYEVRISTNGGVTLADFTTVIFKTEEELDSTVERSVALKDFAGKDIRIAFRNVSNDKYILNIDNVLVEDLKSADARLVSIDVEKYSLTNTSKPLGFTIENRGIDKITSVEIEWTNGIESGRKTISGLNLNYLDKYKGFFDQLYKVFDPEIDNVTIKITKVNGTSDSNVGNNQIVSKLYGVSKPNPRVMVAEDLTSTTCVLCPSGIVAQKQLTSLFPLTYMPINVHFDDPMELPTYSKELFIEKGEELAPISFANRIAQVKPNDLLNYYNTSIKNQHNPIKVAIETSLNKRNMSVEIAIDFLTEFSNEKLSLIAMLIEDNVKGSDDGYNQANGYAGGALGVMGGFEKLTNPVPASQMIYQNVARSLLYNFEGKSDVFNTNIKAGDFKDIFQDLEINAAYNLNEVYVVVLITDSEGRVVGVGKSKKHTVSTQEQNSLLALSIYPNPASTEIKVKLDGNSHDMRKLEIYDMLGRKVISDSSAYDQEHSIAISSLVPGTYILVSTSGNLVQRAKFIKN
jgi:hypothetical protein